jgi:hypothetical protein
LLENCPQAEVSDLISLARDLLPLADLATGPAISYGIGPGYFPPDHVLDQIAGWLGAYPGHGWILIKTALRNRVIGCRNTAISTLTRWPAQTIPSDAATAVRDALHAEPEPEIRKAMEQLLGAWNA